MQFYMGHIRCTKNIQFFNSGMSFIAIRKHVNCDLKHVTKTINSIKITLKVTLIYNKNLVTVGSKKKKKYLEINESECHASGVKENNIYATRSSNVSFLWKWH